MRIREGISVAIAAIYANKLRSFTLTVPRIPAWGGVLAQVAGGAEVRTGYNDVNATYAEAMDWEVQEGRFISDEDIENAAKVCVLVNKRNCNRQNTILSTTNYTHKSSSRNIERF